MAMKKGYLITLSAIILIAVGLIIIDTIRSPDDITVNHPDLEVSQRNLLPEQNAYTYFCLATNTFYYPELSYYSPKTNIEDQIREGVWATNRIAEILQKNVATFEFLEKGLEPKHYSGRGKKKRHLTQP